MNPKEIVIASAFIKALADEPGYAKAPHVRHYVLLTQYTKEATRASAGQPDIAAFFAERDLVNISKSTELVNKMEAELKLARASYLPILERQLAPQQARLEIAGLADLLVRCAFQKPFPAHMNLKGLSRWTPEKVKTIKQIWAKATDAKYPDLCFLTATGLESLGADAADKDLMERVSARSLKRIKSADGETAENDEGLAGDDDKGIKIGDNVTVIRRFTVTIQLLDKTLHRKDVIENTKAIVKGYADLAHRQVLIEFDLAVPLKQGEKKTTLKTIVDKTFPRNLELTEKYEADKVNETIEKAAAKAIEAPKPADAGASPASKSYKWLFEHLEVKDHTEVKVDKDWIKRIADEDNLVRINTLRGKVAVGLHAIWLALPKFTPKDLVVCHRQNLKGAWEIEVWANRDFGVHELLIGAMAADIRERLWSKGSAVIIGLPQHGSSKHPEGKNMALDGRGRQVIAAEKTIDEGEHRGGLFWAIQARRTGELNQGHNMIIDTISMSSSYALKLPGGKKYKLDMESKDLPTLPVMTNPNKIKMHTRLVVYQDLDKLHKLSKEAAQ